MDELLDGETLCGDVVKAVVRGKVGGGEDGEADGEELGFGVLGVGHLLLFDEWQVLWRKVGDLVF